MTCSFIKKFMQHALSDSKSQKILAFLLLNLSFMFVELLVGYLSNSLGLISDAGHMLFDCMSLFIGLFAAFAASWQADGRFTYGYARYEVLSGFVNGIFLIFVAFAVLTESLSRITEPPEVHSGHLLVTSVTGLVINMIGLVFFHDFSHGGNHEMCSHDHGGSGSNNGGCSHGGSHGHHHGHSLGSSSGGSSDDQNIRGIFLHILADALGSVGVVFSSLLIKYFGWHVADPICSCMISILILLSVIPLLQDTSKILLQQIPSNKAAEFQASLNDISNMISVRRVDEPHFWSVRGGLFVTTLHVIVDENITASRRQQLLNDILQKLKLIGANYTTVQITKNGCSHFDSLEDSRKRMGIYDYDMRKRVEMIETV
jgi:solute carrier family 30 (zinc transporter), member 5/7